MADYHKYVFDKENRRFVGEFEELYQKYEDPWDIGDAENLSFDIMLTMLKKHKFSKILEAGCGKGALANRLKALGEVVGVDISEIAIEKAKQLHPDMKFLASDVKDIKFPEDSFDLIVFANTIHFVVKDEQYEDAEKDIDKVMNNFKNILTKEGYILVTLYLPENPIGKHVIANSGDLINLVGKYFDIVEVVEHIKNLEKYPNDKSVFILAKNNKKLNQI